MDSRLDGTTWTLERQTRNHRTGEGHGGVRFAWEEKSTSRCCEHVREGALHCTIAHTFDLDFVLNVQLLAMHPWRAQTVSWSTPT